MCIFRAKVCRGRSSEIDSTIRESNFLSTYWKCVEDIKLAIERSNIAITRKRSQAFIIIKPIYIYIKNICFCPYI